MSTPADEAADLLIHYFRMLGRVDRDDWDPDYSAEIRNAVDRLMDAARDIAREEIEALEARVRELERDTPRARQLQRELDETLADNAAAGYGDW